MIILLHHFFLVISLFEITMVKVISRIYNYDQCNWPYPSSNNIFVIPKCSDTSIKTKRNSASDDCVGSHVLASSELYQITNYDGNTDVNNNDDSPSFETPSKNNCSSSYFGDTIITTTTPNLAHFLCPEKNILVFTQKERLSCHHSVTNQDL